MMAPKVYKDQYQVTIQIFHRTKGFPKALRPTLGRKLEEASLECLLNIRKASVSPPSTRLKHLYCASNALDEIRTLMQISKELHAINVSAFSELTSLTKEVGKEIGGLIKYENKHQLPQVPEQKNG